MKNPIQVLIGVRKQEAPTSMEFVLHDEGAQFDCDMTPADFKIAIAVLRDLADALEAAQSVVFAQ